MLFGIQLFQDIKRVFVQSKEEAQQLEHLIKDDVLYNLRTETNKFIRYYVWAQSLVNLSVQVYNYFYDPALNNENVPIINTYIYYMHWIITFMGAAMLWMSYKPKKMDWIRGCLVLLTLR